MVEPEYQGLETNITRTTWQTVRRIINEILGVKGLIQTTPADSETELKGKIKKKQRTFRPIQGRSPWSYHRSPHQWIRCSCKSELISTLHIFALL